MYVYALYHVYIIISHMLNKILICTMREGLYMADQINDAYRCTLRRSSLFTFYNSCTMLPFTVCAHVIAASSMLIQQMQTAQLKVIQFV